MLATWQLGEVFLSMLYFALFFIWISMVISVFSDIFRSKDLGGVAKALWVVFVIGLPYLGVLAYLVVRGGKMQEHAVAAAEASIAYGSPSEELARLADLKDRGVIDDAEFTRLKGKLVG